MQRYLSGVVLVAVVMAAGITPPVAADCGSIPFLSPHFPYVKIPGVTKSMAQSSNSAKVAFDPLQVRVFEPGQRAVILWNGYEEMLVLSTDLRASQATSLLEVIPLPSEPHVKLGDLATFKKIEKLFIDKQLWAVASGEGAAPEGDAWRGGEVTFHQKMGVHDLSVVKVLSEDHFIQWVQTFLAKQDVANPTIRPEFARIIQGYLDRGCQWFVFDTVHVGETTLTREPVVYRFRTDQVYYPLEVSSLEQGTTKVDLLVVTKDKLSSFPKLRPALRQGETVAISQGELSEISEDWAAFMNSTDLTMQRLTIEGDMGDMRVDLLAE